MTVGIVINQTFFAISPIQGLHNFSVLYINVRENRRGNQGWKSQRHGKQWAKDTERRQKKQKKNIIEMNDQY
jgi:hypothetical protein